MLTHTLATSSLSASPPVRLLKTQRVEPTWTATPHFCGKHYTTLIKSSLLGKSRPNSIFGFQHGLHAESREDPEDEVETSVQPNGTYAVRLKPKPVSQRAEYLPKRLIHLASKVFCSIFSLKEKYSKLIAHFQGIRTSPFELNIQMVYGYNECVSGKPSFLNFQSKTLKYF